MIPRWRNGVTRLAGLLVRRPDLVRRDADDEVASVLDERAKFFVARGMSAQAARDEALRRFGGSVEVARHRVRRSAARRERRMSIHEWMDGFVGDLRYTIRGMRRDPLFSGFAVLTLALGIGANAAMFGIVDKLLLRGPAHVRDASHVVRLFWTMRRAAGDEVTWGAFDPRAYANIVAESHAFSGLAMYTATSRTTLFGTGRDARLVAAASATSNLMSVLGAQPELGRFFTLDEQHSITPARVAVIGYALWQSDFGGDRNIVGHTTTISARPYTIVGVAPQGFTGADLDRVDVWFPLATKSGAAARHWGPGRSSGPAIVGRLRPDVTIEQATADLTATHRRTYDGDDRTLADARVSAGPLHYGPSGTESSAANISRWLAGVSVVVLLLACVNIVNLLLARAVSQRREMAVRLALGAGRARLVRLLLANSLLLALLGAVAGVAVTLMTGGAIRRVLLPELDWTSGPVNVRVFAFSFVVALLTGLAVGLLPALRAGRADLATAMKTGAGEGGGRRSLVRNALMISQAALAMLLLVGAGLFVRSLVRVRGLDLGVQTARVVWLQPRWPLIPAEATADARAREEERRDAFARAALDRLRAIPEIEHVAATISMPFGNAMAISLRVPGWDSLPKLKGGFTTPDISAVSPDYFATMGTRLLRGRTFTSADRTGSEPVAIVSETMAKALWPGRDAIGQCLLIGDGAAGCSQVVGVVQDVRRGRIREDPFMHYYVPLGQEQKISGPELVVRPRGDAEEAIPSLRAIISQIDPSIAFIDAVTLQNRVEPQTRSWKIGAMMFSLFAALALVVAGVGVFSVVAYLMEQRRREIGIRVALGAQHTQIVVLMLRGAVGLTIAGVAVGLVLSMLAAPFAQPLLFDTSPRDPAIMGSVAVILTLVSLLASAVPAWRARRVDPLTALREE